MASVACCYYSIFLHLAGGQEEDAGVMRSGLEREECVTVHASNEERSEDQLQRFPPNLGECRSHRIILVGLPTISSTPHFLPYS